MASVNETIHLRDLVRRTQEYYNKLREKLTVSNSLVESLQDDNEMLQEMLESVVAENKTKDYDYLEGLYKDRGLTIRNINRVLCDKNRKIEKCDEEIFKLRNLIEILASVINIENID